MKVLIVEDEELAGERLKDLVLAYDPEITIMDILDTVSGTVSFLRKQHQSVDLIFLDIQLADGKSFEIFQQFNVLIPVIFTTAYDNYAMDAFELNSIDYLMKPIASPKLHKALDKYARVVQNSDLTPRIDQKLAQQLLEKKAFKTRFVVTSGQRILFKESDQIGYFFAQDKSCFLIENEENKRFLVDYTLDYLESILDPRHYFRINRSVIINIQFIKEVRSYIGKRLKVIPAVSSKDDFTVSRKRVAAFKAWLEG